jgi:hypothetical protein
LPERCAYHFGHEPEPSFSKSCGQTVASAAIDLDLSALRASGDRGHADGRLPVLLLLQKLRRTAETEAGRLLRVLLLWLRVVSADTGGELLRIVTPRHPSRTLQ